MDMYQKRKMRKEKREQNEEQNQNGTRTCISWYPGHMAKTKRQIKEDINLIDVVVELLDARIPLASQNPDIKEIIAGKKRIVALNKCDLANAEENEKWVKYFKAQELPVVLTNLINGKGLKELLSKIEEIMKPELEKQAARGRVGKPIRVMILGIPNVGKSSLINKITVKKSAQVGNRPGVTRQKQWIKLSNKIDLLDTPGVLWPKFESQEVGLNLSYIGTIKDENLQITEIAYNLVNLLRKDYINNLINRYKFSLEEYNNVIENNDGNIATINLIATKRGFLTNGGELDIEKTCNIILDEFRSGQLGHITLEKAEV